MTRQPETARVIEEATGGEVTAAELLGVAPRKSRRAKRGAAAERRLS